ncbi:MAG: DEAD/DEAH box helicase, partial [Planctomycetota bacterium]
MSAEDQISEAMIRDRFRLRKLLQKSTRIQDPVAGKAAREEFELALNESLERVHGRREKLPRLQFAPDLPINEHRERIADAIQTHQVVVVCGETGSGKSTQLPKICLEAGFGVQGMIGHTQPRRLAARSIANRLADELQRPLGKEVGFKIRFTDQTDPATYVKLMTDGILLAETQRDRFLEQYEVVIIDEAHERSLNIDFLLGYIKRLVSKRPELRLVITSATIDAERFSQHFRLRGNPAPIIEVSGRTYPVEIRYQPLTREEEEEEDRDQITGIVEAAHELAAIDRGHILVFLATEREIRETAKRLRAEKFPGET